MAISQRIGIMTGTFDPFHFDHLALAKVAVRTRAVSQVLVVPSGTPWHRRCAPGANGYHRLRMAQLGSRGAKSVSVVDVDICRSGPTYTADTLRLLTSRFDRKTTTFALLMGSDTLGTMSWWRDVEWIFDHVDILVRPRQNHSVDTEYPTGARVEILHGKQRGISATACRTAIMSGHGLEAMVPSIVLRYIARNRLYGWPLERSPYYQSGALQDPSL